MHEKIDWGTFEKDRDEIKLDVKITTAQNALRVSKGKLIFNQESKKVRIKTLLSSK